MMLEVVGRVVDGVFGDVIEVAAVLGMVAVDGNEVANEFLTPQRQILVEVCVVMEGRLRSWP